MIVKDKRVKYHPDCAEENNRIVARARYHNNKEECLKYIKWYREGGKHLIKQKRGDK